MAQKLFYICNIIADSEEDYTTLQEYLGNYPVSIVRHFPEELYFDIPTLAVGWNSIKNKFPNHNITNRQIGNKLFWSFSKVENEKEFFKDVECFFAESVKKWMPSNFKKYDFYLNKESFEDFININVKADEKVFVYFYEGALYINNDNNNLIVNVKSMSISDVNFKDTLTKIFNKLNIVAFSCSNIFNYVNLTNLKRIVAIDSLRWVKYGVETTESYFNIIPNFKIHKYIPFLMSKINYIELYADEQKFYERMYERDEITHWLSNREIAFSPEFENKKLYFKIRKKHKLAKISFSDKRTITGRITSADPSRYNPQNLDKNNDDRKDIISRFEGGNILVFDYVSFETKISIYETKNLEYINRHVNSDFHKEIAILLYESNEITDEKREFAKSIVHPLVYGSSDSSLLAKLTDFSEPECKLYQIKQFLKPIIDKSKEINALAKQNGYVITPLNSIIRLNKEHAGFNNYIQAYASEIVVDKLFEIKEFLKPYKTQFMFQVYDSLVFDLHSSEKLLVGKIKNLLSKYNDMQFGLGINIGPNYKELTEVIH